MNLDRVVVVGGSIAALTAVETLRAEAFSGDITVLSDEDVAPYTRVPLSKGVLAGVESIDDIVLAPLADEVDLRLRTRALSLDVDQRVVHTGDGPIPYDGLVIATGSRARRIGRPDQAEMVLRTHADCVRLNQSLLGAALVLVVGGGFLGMEIASTCRRLGMEVTVVDLAPPLDRLLGRVVGAHIRARAERAGVRLLVARVGSGCSDPRHRPASRRRTACGSRPTSSSVPSVTCRTSTGSQVQACPPAAASWWTPTAG